mgnify:CR=1 FL=1
MQSLERVSVNCMDMKIMSLESVNNNLQLIFVSVVPIIYNIQLPCKFLILLGCGSTTMLIESDKIITVQQESSVLAVHDVYCMHTRNNVVNKLSMTCNLGLNC